MQMDLVNKLIAQRIFFETGATKEYEFRKKQIEEDEQKLKKTNMTAIDHANNIVELGEKINKGCRQIMIRLDRPRHLRTLRYEKFNKIIETILIESK